MLKVIAYTYYWCSVQVLWVCSDSFILFGLFEVWFCLWPRRIWQKWLWESDSTHMQKNRRPIILCSKLSLIHTINAPYKYFEYALIVSFYLDFLRFGFAIRPAKFGKSDNWKVTLLICKKSQTYHFMLKVIAYTYYWCSVQVFWVCSDSFILFGLFEAWFCHSPRQIWQKW